MVFRQKSLWTFTSRWPEAKVKEQISFILICFYVHENNNSQHQLLHYFSLEIVNPIESSLKNGVRTCFAPEINEASKFFRSPNEAQFQPKSLVMKGTFEWPQKMAHNFRLGVNKAQIPAPNFWPFSRPEGCLGMPISAFTPRRENSGIFESMYLDGILTRMKNATNARTARFLSQIQNRAPRYSMCTRPTKKASFLALCSIIWPWHQKYVSIRVNEGIVKRMNGIVCSFEVIMFTNLAPKSLVLENGNEIGTKNVPKRAYIQPTILVPDKWLSGIWIHLCIQDSILRMNAWSSSFDRSKARTTAFQ